MLFELSETVILLSYLQPLFVKKGRMVGHKSLDFGPPPHLSETYNLIDSLFSFVTLFL